MLPRCLFYALFNNKSRSRHAASSCRSDAQHLPCRFPPVPPGPPRLPTAGRSQGEAGGGGAGPGAGRKAALPILGEIVRRSGEGRAAGTNLPFLELLPCQEAPARRLEEGDVPAGLRVPLLLQPGQRPGPEKHLREGNGVRYRRVPASLRPRRATLPLLQLARMRLFPLQPLVLSRRGGFISQA